MPPYIVVLAVTDNVPVSDVFQDTVAVNVAVVAPTILAIVTLLSVSKNIENNDGGVAVVPIINMPYLYRLPRFELRTKVNANDDLS